MAITWKHDPTQSSTALHPAPSHLHSTIADSEYCLYICRCSSVPKCSRHHCRLQRKCSRKGASMHQGTPGGRQLEPAQTVAHVNGRPRCSTTHVFCRSQSASLLAKTSFAARPYRQGCRVAHRKVGCPTWENCEFPSFCFEIRSDPAPTLQTLHHRALAPCANHNQIPLPSLSSHSHSLACISTPLAHSELTFYLDLFAEQYRNL